MKINTYAVNCNDAWLNTEGDDISGSYVKYKDHQEVVAALEAKCAALATELETALRECRSAGITIDNLEAKCAALLDELDKWKQESSAWQVVAEKQLALATSAEQKIAELESLTEPQLPHSAVVSVPEVVGLEDVPEEITEDDIALASAWAIGFNQCRAAMLNSFGNSEQLDEVGSWNNHRNTPTAQDGNHTEQNLDMVDHFGEATQKAMLHGSEPETDNTAQQFESLSRGNK